VEKGKNRNILKTFHIRDCKSWGYKPNALFTIEAKMETDAEYHTSFEFTTKEGDKICHLLTDYAMAFLKEAELEQIRCEELGISTEGLDLAGMHVAIPAPRAPPPPPKAPKSTPKSKMKSSKSKPKPSIPTSKAAHRGATKIQALWRGFNLRWEWLKEDAAIIIQMIVRGFLARCLVSDMLEELYANGELELMDDYN
jgi:hypothetical protein